MIYVLILLCLSLAGIAGLQFFYMMYLEQSSKGYRKRIRDLERHCVRLSKRLQVAESTVARQEKLMSADEPAFEDDEVWADVLEDH